MQSHSQMHRCRHLIGRSRGETSIVRTSSWRDSRARTFPAPGSAKVFLVAPQYYSTTSPDWLPSQPQLRHCVVPDLALHTRTHLCPCAYANMLVTNADTIMLVPTSSLIVPSGQVEFKPPVPHIFLENVRHLTGMTTVWSHVLKSLHTLGYQAILQAHNNSSNSWGRSSSGREQGSMYTPPQLVWHT